LRPSLLLDVRQPTLQFCTTTVTARIDMVIHRFAPCTLENFNPLYWLEARACSQSCKKHLRNPVALRACQGFAQHNPKKPHGQMRAPDRCRLCRGECWVCEVETSVRGNLAGDGKVIQCSRRGPGFRDENRQIVQPVLRF
jgi:hypothetical protein